MNNCNSIFSRILIILISIINQQFNPYNALIAISCHSKES